MNKPSFSYEEVLDTVESVLGRVSWLAATTEGEESQAFRCSCGTREYMVRLNRRIEGFEKDAFAHRRFASANLPIPQVIHIGQIDNCFFCISEFVPGVTLQDLSPADLAPLLRPTAEVLHSLADCELGNMNGCGPFDAGGAGRYRSWRDYLVSIADRGHFDWTATYKYIDAAEVARIIQRVTSLAERCPEVSRLVHGDFGSNNVLTDGARITGVVDWSEASIGDPLYDIANVFFWRTWLPCMEQQAAYFEGHLEIDEAMRERLLCYQLRIGLAELYHGTLDGNSRVTTWAMSRCRELSR